MFCSHDRLKKHTPTNGIDRKEYVGLLVEEYYETTDLEAKEQVTANLANFAYDPINYQHLKESAAIELFLELITSPNPRMVLHGIAGLCNLVADEESSQKILECDGLTNILNLLKRPEDEILLNSIATLIQLDTSTIKKESETINSIKSLQDSQNVSIKNLATVLLSQLTSP